jgi:FkbM family methyltransferase
MSTFFTLFALADGRKERFRLAVWYLRLQGEKRLLRRPAPARRQTIFFRANGQRFPFTLHGILDFHVLKEVFLSKEYALDPETPIRTILDLGANIGASVTWFALAFPDARLAAIEPNPDCFAHLQENVRPFQNRVTLAPIAVTTADAPLTFYQNQEHWGGSLIQRSTGSSYTVQGQTIKTTLANIGWTSVDLVKVDIEGGEYAIAEDLARLRPRYLIAEVHPDLANLPFSTFREAFADYREIARFEHGPRVVIQLARSSQAR